MKISQLQHFTTLAELQNVSKASELLHVSQSALSKTILSLENELGVNLFDRKGKHVSLNAAGQRFLDACHNILDEYNASLEDIHVITTGNGSKIKIGSCGNINAILQPMVEFKSIHSDTEYDINCDIEGDDYIDINAYDVLIYPDEPKYSRFNGYPLYEENYYLAVSASHPLSSASSVNVSDLSNLDMVFLSIGKSKEFPSYICSALSVQPASQSYVSSRSLHRDAIQSGLAAGFVPESEKAIYSSTDIKLLPIEDSNFTRKFNICFKRKKRLSQLAQQFEEFIKEKLSLTQA